MLYTCFLFDLDNTLVDTEPINRSALEQCGCPKVDDLTSSDLRSFSPNELLKRAGHASATDRYWRCYGRLVRTESRLFDPKTPAVLAELQKRGARIGLVTSSPKSITEVMLSACGVADQFASCMVTYGTCRRRKPFPDPILAALKMLRHPPSGSIYIGDAQKDAQASRAAGTHFGFAAWSRTPKQEASALRPNQVFVSMSDILVYT